MARIPDDETLMAYVDEALPADEMRRIKAILDAYPDEQVRLLPFIVTQRTVARSRLGCGQFAPT